MNISQMRDVVAGLYRGQKWKDRVHRMSEKQIYAIYMDRTEQGRKKKVEYKQLNLFGGIDNG